MASEKDLELLDDYISNRLNGADREAFELKLEQDPTLKSELGLQRQIADAIRSASAKELKNMLNQVPQSELGPQQRLSYTFIALTVALIVGVALFFYLRPSTEPAIKVVQTPVQEQPVLKQEEVPQPAEDPVANLKGQQEPASQAPVVNPQQRKAPTSDPVKEPKLEVFDPTKEEVTDESENNAEILKNSPSTSPTIAVDTDNTNKKYSFHYEFKDDKVTLYGSFEKNLYEILEFFTDNKRTVFLFYKNNYYLLNQSPGKVTPLAPVNDPVLLKRLREYRTN